MPTAKKSTKKTVLPKKTLKESSSLASATPSTSVGAMAVEIEPETPLAESVPAETVATDPIAPDSTPAVPPQDPVAVSAPPDPAPAELPVTPTEPKVVKVGGKFILETPPAASVPVLTAVDPLAPTPTALPTPVPGHLTPLPQSAVTSDTSKYTLAEEVPLEKTNKRLFAIGITLLVLVLASTGMLYYFRTQVLQQSQTGTPVTDTASPAPEASAIASPAAVTGLTRDQITLEVLNGTKTPGLAGNTADTFEALGYTIGKTGNSPDDATENQLFIDKSLEGQLDTLLADVKSELKIASVSGYLTGSNVSARIVLGSE